MLSTHFQAFQHIIILLPLLCTMADSFNFRNHQARFYEKGNLCAAFLWNNKTHASETVKFKGKQHTLPPKSISILPDCKTVVYNTDHVSSIFLICNNTQSEPEFDFDNDIFAHLIYIFKRKKAKSCLLY